MVHSVSDLGSNPNENIDNAARAICRSRHRRLVFTAIYTGKRRSKTVSDLMKATSPIRTRVLDAGKKLADAELVKTTKINGQTAYEKIGFYQSNRQRILSLAASPAKLAAFPTKRSLRATAAVVQIQLSSRGARHQHVSVDEIDSFHRVRSVDSDEPEIGDELSEAQFKSGMQKIIGEGGRFKDWGGEIADLFATQLRLGGRRRPTVKRHPGLRVKATSTFTGSFG